MFLNELPFKGKQQITSAIKRERAKMHFRFYLQTNQLTNYAFEITYLHISYQYLLLIRALIEK